MKYIVLIVVLITFTILVYPKDSAGAVQIKAKVEQKEVDKMKWTKNTFKLHSTLVKEWMDTELAKYLINACKSKANDPRKCVIHASMISKAESNLWNNASNGNMFGITGFKGTKKQAIDTWVSKYNKFWYTNKSPYDYYKSTPTAKPRSVYCMSEYQPDGKHLNYCKNGIKHANYMFNLLAYDR